MLIVSVLLAPYYNMVIGWALVFLVNSFTAGGFKRMADDLQGKETSRRFEVCEGNSVPTKISAQRSSNSLSMERISAHSLIELQG
jgi:SNF family Na+-dependent transporter